MTEPSPPRPVPGPPRPGPSPASASPEPESGPVETASAATDPEERGGTEPAPDGDGFGDLAARPVTEHVAIFEAEHARLRDELSTIDQL